MPGFEVVDVAHSGAEALAAVDRLRPELVVLDVYLPDVRGLAVLRELRQREPPVDVIVVTASSDIAALQSALEYGALRYIVKPFDFARFRQTLEATALPPQAIGSRGPFNGRSVILSEAPCGSVAGARQRMILRSG